MKGRPKQFTNAKRVSVVLSEEQLEQIERMTNHIGMQESRKVTGVGRYKASR